MSLILLGLGLIFPRILILVLHFFTSWFNGLWDTTLWPLIGFLFMPITLLWFSVAINYFGGWTTASIAGMVIAITIDLGMWNKGRKSKR